jgi:tRNA threonylcarbamoyladenosine biosynthesis protein TsaB
MALILNIDTALEEASVCLSDGADVIAIKRNNHQQEHAAWIHQAIRQILDESGRLMSNINAVAVTAGPGSYTGLRVGMATAKGICYALNVPLITESTLLLTAQRVKKEIATEMVKPHPVLICPMIDARRMEVFTCLYDLNFTETLAAAPLILNEQTFGHELANHVILFCGNGSKKWQNLCIHPHAVFADVTHDATDLAASAAQKFEKVAFSDLAYTEPTYLKHFYSGK